MGRGKDDDDESEDYSDDQKQDEKVEIRKPKIERIDKFKNLKKIVINVSMTQYPVVVEVAEHLNWKVQYSNDAGDWDVYWTDFAIDPEILIKMHLFQKINHYPGIHVIARKNLLGLTLMSLRNHFPDQYNFFPLTWMLPMQYVDFRNYFQSKPKGKARTYIVKPEADCQGRGIFLTRKMQDLQNGKHYVVQRYLARPFLLQGLKFDLRIYVLLCGTNPLRLYMFNEGLARLATQQYTEPTTANLQHQYMHLTNYAINKNNPKFIFNNNSGNMGIGHKRSLTCVFKQLAAKGVNIEQLKTKINDVAIKTIICGLPLMSHQYKCSQPQDYSGNMCFHILGLDIMMNAKGEPVLLEVNHTPSFTTDTPLDQKIKFDLIRDTLKLMNINANSKSQLFNKAKDLNQQRLLTGKRQIFEGKERQEMIAQAQRLRDEYEDKNLGGFQRIFPLKDEQQMKKYNKIIETSQKIYAEENGSIRMKMMEKQAKKLIREDAKQRKKGKDDVKNKQDQKAKEVASQPASTQSPVVSKHHFNSEHYVKTHQESVEDRQDQSIIENPQMTKSQHCLNNQQIEISLIKKYSENNQKQKQKQKQMEKQREKEIDKQSLMKIKKYAIQNDVPQAEQQQLNKSNQNKSTVPQSNKIHSKQAIRNIPSYMYQKANYTPAKQDRNRTNLIATKATNSRKINSRGQQPQLPNIIDNINPNNDISALLRREQKLLSLQKGVNRTDSKKGRIYDNINKDIREMIQRKSGIGGYVMPKLININIQNERRQTQNPNSAIPHRKGNTNNIFIYSNHNE